MRILLFFSFLFFFISSQAFASAKSLKSVGGGWETIVDTRDPNVQKVAEFAVSEYAKQQGKSFELADVIAAQRQVVVAGLKYRLVLDAKTPTGNVSKYGVLVDESLTGDLKLVAFEPVRPLASTNSSTKTKVGGWQTIINLQDPEVQKVAAFAVSEYGKQQGARFELVDVFAGRRQVVVGVKYQLVLDVKTPSKSVSKFEALVNESLKGDLELVSFAQVKPPIN